MPLKIARTPVKIPITFDAANGAGAYSLVGVACRQGRFSVAGHWVVYIQPPGGGNALHCDDDQITEIAMADAVVLKEVRQTATVLFYLRTNPQ